MGSVNGKQRLSRVFLGVKVAGMRSFSILILAATTMIFAATDGIAAAAKSNAKIIKVLPTFLDMKGRHSLSPSLYERDAYQALLRKDKKQISGMRFDVQWKAPSGGSEKLLLRLELRVSKAQDAKHVILDKEVERKKSGSRWSRLILDGETFREAGEVLAWRATLLDGGTKTAERTSFLW